MKVIERDGRFVKLEIAWPEIQDILARHIRKRVGEPKEWADGGPGLIRVSVALNEVTRDPEPPRRHSCYQAGCAVDFASIQQLEAHCRLEHGVCGTNVCGYGPCERELGHEGGHSFAMFGTVEI